jgi:hypothetical protein
MLRRKWRQGEWPDAGQCEVAPVCTFALATERQCQSLQHELSRHVQQLNELQPLQELTAEPGASCRELRVQGRQNADARCVALRRAVGFRILRSLRWRWKKRLTQLQRRRALSRSRTQALPSMLSWVSTDLAVLTAWLMHDDLDKVAALYQRHNEIA